MNDRMPTGYRGTMWLMALPGAVVMVISMWGCAAGQRPPESGSTPVLSQEDKDERPLVVTTVSPYYDFVRQTAGDKVKPKLVVLAGMDNHPFESTSADIVTIQEADVLICDGGEMKQWVKKALSPLDTNHMRILTMMDYVDVVEEKYVESMEENGHHHEDVYEEDGHEKDDHEEEDDHEMHIEYDEHVWTSPISAQAIVKIISRTLAEAAPGEQSRSETNTQTYLQELEGLGSQFKQVADQGRLHMIVVADEFPSHYFADEYGFSYRATFPGYSRDAGPNASTITYLIDKVREDRIPAVYYLEFSGHRTTGIIQEGTEAAPLPLHPCRNVTRKQFDEDVTYLQLMGQDVENLRYGLG